MKLPIVLLLLAAGIAGCARSPLDGCAAFAAEHGAAEYRIKLWAGRGYTCELVPEPEESA